MKTKGKKSADGVPTPSKHHMLEREVEGGAGGAIAGAALGALAGFRCRHKFAMS